MNSLHNPTLAPYAKPTGTELRVTAHARTEAEALARITPVVDQVKALLGDKVIGVDVSCLEEVCYGLLKEGGSPWAPPSPAPAVSWPSFSPTCPAPLPCFGGHCQLYQCGESRCLGGPSDTAGPIRRGLSPR